MHPPLPPKSKLFTRRHPGVKHRALHRPLQEHQRHMRPVLPNLPISVNDLPGELLRFYCGLRGRARDEDARSPDKGRQGGCPEARRRYLCSPKRSPAHARHWEEPGHDTPPPDELDYHQWARSRARSAAKSVETIGYYWSCSGSPIRRRCHRAILFRQWYRKHGVD